MKRGEKGKRAQESLLSFIIFLVIALAVFASLLLFIRTAASGKLLEQQVLAKQAALLIDAARPKTEITLYTGNFSLVIEGNNVKVSEKEKTGYSYDFFSPYHIEIEKKDARVLIKIS